MVAKVRNHFLVIITDLDGTLLDQRTYSYEPSLPAVVRLRELNYPLVLCSSKTAAEIIALQGELGLKDPFICESGGAIYLPQNCFPEPIAAMRPRRRFDVIEFGKRIFYLRQALQETAKDCGATVQSFGTMTFQEIMLRTGLTLDQAIHARQREYDEPFFIDAGDEARFLTALQEQGLTITKGDRFYHLTAGHDKGGAVRVLLGHYRRHYPSLRAIGLGNSANDLALLREADIAVLVRNPDGQWDAEVTTHLPNVQRTDGIGPVGWREAIENLLDSSGL